MPPLGPYRKLHWPAEVAPLQQVSDLERSPARMLLANFGRDTTRVTGRSPSRRLEFDNSEYSVLFRRRFHSGQNLLDRQAVLEIRMEGLSSFE